MVPLNNKSMYIEKIANRPKLLSFYKLLNNETIKQFGQDEAIEINRFYYDFMKSVQEDNQKHFSDYYNEFSKRKPSQESPWIYDDILLFVVICGLVKYNMEKEWILEVISLRSNSIKLSKSVNTTFTNIVNSNYNSKDNLFEIIIVFLNLLNIPQLNNELLNIAYLSIRQKFDIEYLPNDFLQIVALKAFDIIILSKETPDSTEIWKLRGFRNTFLSRVDRIRDLIYYALIIMFFIFNYYLIKTSEGFKNYLTDISVIAGILGIGVIAAFKWVRQLIGWAILKLLGYQKYYKELPKSK